LAFGWPPRLGPGLFAETGATNPHAIEVQKEGKRIEELRHPRQGFSYMMALLMAAPLIVAAKAVYDFRNGPVKGALADAQTQTYLAEHSGPFCAFEGVWYDWEHDETITLRCLEVKGNVREASYSSAVGASCTRHASRSSPETILQNHDARTRDAAALERIAPMDCRSGNGADANRCPPELPSTLQVSPGIPPPAQTDFQAPY
jgi:hypothetical protein